MNVYNNKNSELDYSTIIKYPAYNHTIFTIQKLEDNKLIIDKSTIDKNQSIEFISNTPKLINNLYKWLINGFMDKDLYKGLKDTLLISVAKDNKDDKYCPSTLVIFDFDQLEKDGIISKLSRLKNNKYVGPRKTYKQLMDFKENNKF